MTKKAKKILLTVTGLFLLPWFAKKVTKIAGIILLPYSVIILIKKRDWKKIKKYRYEVARAWDILANKLYAPALDKHLSVKQLSPFGQDETISENMARNKFVVHDNSGTADWWETKVINKFEKNHLLITLAKNNQMTKQNIIDLNTQVVTNAVPSKGLNDELTESEVATITEVMDEVTETVNPNLPPRPNA